ncbi:unnamed protein product [Zymoseptoria tritici ST99CH_1A5]|uniref:Uncharacterized protein n=1 Tax=Zymoseptoria tritici ST99CH_1A5 TaxID=1276529 RepID=A0A1Y6LUK7_ZYMTR|nr:unnamed protein product [Zymoseptoria tritici ST99CH_1A5]
MFPYQLTLGQSDFKDVICNIGAVDLPSRQLLMPLLKTYNKLSAEATDRVTHIVTATNAMVDKTISARSEAQYRLNSIEGREKSSMSSWLPKAASERAIIKIFTGMTKQLGQQMDHVLVHHQDLNETLVEVRHLLDRVAISLGPRHKFQREKLSKATYWKRLLVSHQAKMKDFLTKMETCAELYEHTLRAGLVLAVTSAALHDTRGRVKGMQDELQRVSVSLASSGASLRHTIFSLGGSIAYLEESRDILKQRERLQAFKRKLSE